MQKRETARGINLNGKSVRPGMYAVLIRGEAAKMLEQGPNKPTRAMEEYLRDAPWESEYTQAVLGHQALDSISAKLKKYNPNIASFTIGFDDSEIDDWDEYSDELPGFFIDRLILNDGTEVDLDPSLDHLHDELDGVAWNDKATHCGAGILRDRYTLQVEVESAMDIPRYLRDPCYKDAPPVPSTVENWWGFEEAHSLAKVEYLHRTVLNNEMFTFPDPDNPHVQKGIDEIGQLASQRAAELIAAGVTR